jgi:hypothetical protein
MADKKAALDNDAAVVIESKELKHFVKLHSPTVGSITREVKDRDNLGRIDAAYHEYELFSRAVVTLRVGDDKERIRSSPLNASGVISNPSFGQA